MASQPQSDATEEPTPRRLRRARDEGQIASSPDLGASAALAAGVLTLIAGGGVLAQGLVTMTRAHLERAPAGANLGGSLEAAIMDVGRLSLPVVGAAAIAALVVGGLQAGGLFTWKPLAPRLDRLDPVAGLGRMFGGEALVGVLKGLVKLAVVSVVAWLTLAPHLGALPHLAGAAPSRWAGATFELALTLALRVTIAFAVLGAADYLWQRRKHLVRLRMTRDEVRREHREDEGDPQHKAERRRMHQELLRHSMVEAVRTADCVIVNPEHIAVALRYDQATMGAPQVVATGEDLVAAHIREVARQHGVPIFRDVPLARALAGLEPGDEIPEALYEAVAELLRVLEARP
jgi:flagellar biosynthesis protein FlhB